MRKTSRSKGTGRVPWERRGKWKKDAANYQRELQDECCVCDVCDWDATREKG